MKLQKAIDTCRALRPNQYETDDLIEAINTFEETMRVEVMRDRCGCPCKRHYTEADMGDELLIPAPYDDLYTLYLIKHIEYYNGEMARYNNSLTVFENRYKDFSAYWARTHRQVADNHLQL